MQCYVCLEPYEPYEGHGKLCPGCRLELEGQERVMKGRGDFDRPGDLPEVWQAYLEAFDRLLRGEEPETAREDMRWALARAYDGRGVAPPERLKLPQALARAA